MLRKLMMLAAMLALVLAVVVPALAADRNNNHKNHNNRDGGGTGISLPFDQQIEPTGNVTTTTNVTSSGDNGNQCVAPLQFGNTGNVQNAQGFLQYGSTSGDIEFGGSSMEFNPTLNNTCNQTVQQAAAAGN